jgi:uncharacterized membrane protein YsdA (DUF1294 family)
MYLVVALVVWNAFVLLMYAQDKRKAKRGQYRISEQKLLLAAFFFGSAGAFAGMSLFRHKTKHLKFKILIPLFLLIHAVLIYFLSPYLFVFLLGS